MLEEGDEEDRRYRDKLHDEITICKDLRHPHIVSYLGQRCPDHRPWTSLLLEHPFVMKAAAHKRKSAKHWQGKTQNWS